MTHIQEQEHETVKALFSELLLQSLHTFPLPRET